MRPVSALYDLRRIKPRAFRRALLTATCLALTLPLAGCSGGGIYANVGISGPSIDVGPVSVRTGVSFGRWL